MAAAHGREDTRHAAALAGRSPVVSLVTLTVVASLSGIGNGFNLTLPAAIGPVLASHFRLSLAQEGLLAAAVYAGAVVGCLVGGGLVEWLGRVRPIIVGETLLLASALASALAPTAQTFAAARAAAGVAVGICIVGKPIYLSEMAPLAERGTLMNLLPVFMSIGALLTHAARASLPTWRHVVVLSVVPPALLLAVACRLPEGPTRVHALPRSSSQGGRDRVPLVAHPASTLDGLVIIWHDRPSRRAAFASLALLLAHQASGPVAILAHALALANNIDARTSASPLITPAAATLALSVCHLVTVVPSLTLVNRAPRTLLLRSALAAIALLEGGLALLLAGGRALSPVAAVGAHVLVMLSVAAYQLGVAGTFWVTTAEIWPARTRAIGLSACYALVFGACTLSLFVWPALTHALGLGGVVALLSALAVLALGACFRLVPETSGLPLGTVFAEADHPGDD